MRKLRIHILWNLCLLFCAITVPSWAAIQPVSQSEARSVAQICKKHQISDVIREHVYALPGSDRRAYLVPSRNNWLKPPTLELQIVEKSRVVSGLAPPLWKYERLFRFKSLERFFFRDLDGDGKTDFALEIHATRPEGSLQRVFAMYVADGKGGFRLKEALPADPRSLPSLSDFIGVDRRTLEEREVRPGLQKKAQRE